MVLDIQESLISALYTRLTDDTDLEELMGGTVRLYSVWAKPDAAFPYLVHRIDMGIDGDWNPERRCTYYLDIWSNSSGTEEITDIRQQVMSLIDDHDSSTDETSEYCLWIQTDGFIPESSENIFHYALQFNLKFVRDSQIGTLLKR